MASRQHAAREHEHTEVEAAGAIGVSRFTVRAWRLQRRIGYIRRGRKVFIPDAEVQRLRRAREVVVPALRQPPRVPLD